MLNSLQDTFALVARVLLALLFIPAGWGKLGAGFAGTAGYVASVGLPAPQLLAGAGLAIELVAGILLLIGLFTRWSALALAIFTLAAAFFFHNYWAMPADQQMMQSLSFWKNIAIAGGLFAITAFGAGAFSLDGKNNRT